MSFFHHHFQLQESTFLILRDLIHENTGIYYHENQRELLADKIAPRLLAYNFDSFLDYYYFLKYDDSAPSEWPKLMDYLAVPETYFWRETDQFFALCDYLLPLYFENQPSRPLKIWSAACSTGEEPISIAIALQEAGWFDKLSISIYASDASSRAIKKAQQGIYQERSFRSLPSHYQHKYFTKCPEGWKISPEIHQHISWQTANLLVHSDIETLARADFIFCRNVFIYFSDYYIKQTVQYFYEVMPSPAYLFISASESLFKLKTSFELEEVGSAFVYLKK